MSIDGSMGGYCIMFLHFYLGMPIQNHLFPQKVTIEDNLNNIGVFWRGEGVLHTQLKFQQLLCTWVAIGTTYMGTGPNGLDKGSL